MDIKVSTLSVDKEVIKRLNEYKKESKTLQNMKRKMGKIFVSREVSKQKILNDKFRSLDKDGKGMISFSDLITVLNDEDAVANDPLITELKQN